MLNRIIKSSGRDIFRQKANHFLELNICFRPNIKDLKVLWYKEKYCRRLDKSNKYHNKTFLVSSIFTLKRKSLISKFNLGIRLF